MAQMGKNWVLQSVRTTDFSGESRGQHASENLAMSETFRK